MREFAVGSLSEYDGTEGKPSYVAFNGKVYDVTRSKLWSGGAHKGRHRAGVDLTQDLEWAPHGEEVFRRFPQVGTLTVAETAEG